MTEKVVIGNATRIYALQGADGRYRYIGKTVQSLRNRLVAHKRTARRKARLPVHYWTRKQPDGYPAIVLVEIVPAGTDWAARERHWIARMRREGHDLLNMTSGGEGLAGHTFSAEHRAKIAAALRTGAECACIRCGATFWRKANEIRRGHDKFCSRRCSNLRNRGLDVAS